MDRRDIVKHGAYTGVMLETEREVVQTSTIVPAQGFLILIIPSYDGQKAVSQSVSQSQ